MSSIRKLSDINFCAIDLETTGVNPAFNKIVEIGAVKFRIDGKTETFHSLVNPCVPMPENVIKIHGITDDMVNSAPVIEELLYDLSGFINDTILVIQNPRFDLSFIDRAFKSHGVECRQLWALDTVRLAKKYFTGLPNHKLSTLSEHLGLNHNKHRALDDAVVCMTVFLEILKGRGVSGDSTLEDLMNLHGERVNPGISSVPHNSADVFKRISIGEKVTIRYRDSDGNITKRNILPKEFIAYGRKNYILAHCYLRNSERCFMASRIIGVD
ncbi:MAG TPA: exonuclease domain-containing protein [Spirochaetota bacterium]|nr:exonuclease domain-containing protein [Spirochaetota bacterium]HPR37875.1 exonuclease domain-containing protein [Spirochaetota bacterium]